MDENRKQIERYKSGRKKKGHSSYILLYIMLGVFAVAVLIILSLTVFFPITNVEIFGSSVYTADEIKAAAKIPMNNNLFTADISMVEDNITEKLPYVETVEVHRSFPSTITLNIVQAQGFAQIENGGKYLCIDKEAKCLEISDSIKKDLPVIRGATVKKFELGKVVGFDTSDNPNLLRCVSDILISAKNNNLTITVVNVDNAQNLWATYSNKIVLLFGSDSNMEKKFEYAVATLKSRENEEETGTLNLSRIPNSKNQVSFIPGTLSKEQIAVFS